MKRRHPPSPTLRRLAGAVLCAALGGVSLPAAAEPPAEPAPGARAAHPGRDPDALQRLREAHDKLREAQEDLLQAQAQLKAAAEEAQGQARSELSRARDTASGAMHALRQMWHALRDKLDAVERETKAESPAP